jgi:hypothetical protein
MNRNPSITNGSQPGRWSTITLVLTLLIVTSALLPVGSTHAQELRRISPVFECWAYNGAGQYTLYFGYNNPNSVSIDIPIGNDNRFTRSERDRGQPTTFLPGRAYKDFAVPFAGNGNISWSLNRKTATGSIQRANQRCSVDAEPDLNDDQHTDMLWRDPATGANAVWFMDGREVLATQELASGSPEAKLMATGDFDGNGEPDMLWRDPATGANAVWYTTWEETTSTVQTTSTALPSVNGGGWNIAGVGDFDADGLDDVLWHSSTSGSVAIWLLDAAGVPTYTPVSQVSDLDWQIDGVGDFDADGHADIFWRHAGRGANAIWLMDGATFGYVPTATVSDQSWQVVGSGDFNNDGKADLLWRNLAPADGKIAIWRMDGAAVSYLPLSRVSDLAWKIAGVGDVNGDGLSDLLWVYVDSLKNAIWTTDGPTYTYEEIRFADSRDWQVVGLGVRNYDASGDIGPAFAANGANDIAGTPLTEAMPYEPPLDIMTFAPVSDADGMTMGAPRDPTTTPTAGGTIYLPVLR